MKRLLLFRVGIKQLAVELQLVLGIHGLDALIAKRENGLEKSMLMIDDEKMVQVINVPSIFGISSSDNLAGKILLLNVQSQLMALKVDHIARIISVQDEQIEALPPVFKGLSLDCFPQVLKHDNTLILLVNPKGIENAEQNIKEIQKIEAERKKEEDDIKAILQPQEIEEIPSEAEEIIAPEETILPEAEEIVIPEETILPEVEEIVIPEEIVPPPEVEEIFVPEETIFQEPEEIIVSEPETSIQEIKPSEPIDSESLEKILMDSFQMESMEDIILQTASELMEKFVANKIRKIKEALVAHSDDALKHDK